MAGDVGTLAAGTNVDQFTIVRLIGRGGMGEVYLAQDQSLGRRVALKLISFEHALGASNVLRARFLYEARTTARFSHPNIVAIYAVGEHQERPYMALEYLEGESLRERIARAGVPAPAEALRIGGAIAAAIAEAHRHGVLHRDLKPGNVMLCDDGRARVVDFGLAMGVAASVGADGQLTSGAGAVGPTPAPAFEHTHTGLRGTPHYMAPELWKEADATPATDVWALGVVLMQLFTGRLPYGDQRSLFALAANVASADPVPGLDALAAAAPEGLREIIGGCLEKAPERRPPAAHVAAALEARARGEAPAAAAIDNPALGPTQPLEAVTPAQRAAAAQPAKPRPRRWPALLALALALCAIGAILAYVLTRDDASAARVARRDSSPPADASSAKASRAPADLAAARAPAPDTTKVAARPPAPKPKLPTKAKAKAKPVAHPTRKKPVAARPPARAHPARERAGKRSIDYGQMRLLARANRCKQLLAMVGDPNTLAGPLRERCDAAWEAGICACKAHEVAAAQRAYRFLYAFLSSKYNGVCKPAPYLNQLCAQHGAWAMRYPDYWSMQFWGIGYRNCGALRRAGPAFLKNPAVSHYHRNAGLQVMIKCACKSGDKPRAKRLLKLMTEATLQQQTIDACRSLKVELL